MKTISYVIAALATIAVAAPSIASAETVVIKHGGMHRDSGMRMHRDWHPHHHDRVVIVHRGHRHY